jgi:hypothetical protein
MTAIETTTASLKLVPRRTSVGGIILRNSDIPFLRLIFRAS